MKDLIKNRKWLLILLLPVSILLINIASLSPGAVEKIYSRGFYLYLSQILSLMAGWIPFSLINLLLLHLYSLPSW
jgi:hypothetical protein